MAASSQINGTVPQGTFGVTQDDKDPSGPAAYPVTTPMGVIPPNVTNVNSGSSSGGSEAGNILGGIGKVVGAILPFFAKGGLVTHGNVIKNEMADGGSVKPGFRLNDHWDARRYDSPNDNDDNADSAPAHLIPLDREERNRGMDMRRRMQDTLNPDSSERKARKGYADGGLTDKIARIDTLSADRAAYDRGERAAGSPSRSFSSIAATDKPMQLKAEGGPIEEPNQEHDPLAIGYLVGALHQKKYGGTPKTLADAANDIKDMLALSAKSRIEQLGHSKNAYDSPLGEERNPNGKGAELENYAHQFGYDNKDAPLPKGYASGGATEAVEPKKTETTPQKSFSSYDDLASYYGESSTGDSNSVGGDTTSGGQSSMPTSNPTVNSLYPPTPTSDSTSSSSTKSTEVDPISITPDIQRGSYKAAQGGYMAQGYAAGGMEQPPLQAGQQFQGDGSVKGPGGPQDDAIPAKLSNGEFVMSQPAVQFFGVDKLNQMNEKGKQGFMQMMQQGGQGAASGQAPQGMPQAPPQMPAPQQPPMKNGGSVMRTKGSGYAGL